MKLKNNYFKYSYPVALLALSAVMFVSFGLVKAQIPGEGLTISPPITEITLKSGESIEKTIRLTNPTDKLVEVYPKVMNFDAKGENGEPAFTEATDDSAKYSLAQWISVSQSRIALTPEQVVEFKYSITVPEKAEPGGHYGVVFFATEPPKLENDSSKVSIGSMIGSLVLVKVPGQIIEKGFLEEFSTNASFYFKNKVNFVTRVSNLGNIHFKPKGNITIKSFTGGTVDTLQLNDQAGNVLPDSTRKFENNWEKSGLLFGRFTADINIVYGENEKTLVGQTTFWIIPWWIFILIAIFVILLSAFIIRRKIKGRNRRPKRPQFPMQSGGDGGGQIILR